MKISYDDRTDLLYLRFDERKQEVDTKKVTDDVVLNISESEDAFDREARRLSGNKLW